MRDNEKFAAFGVRVASEHQVDMYCTVKQCIEVRCHDSHLPELSFKTVHEFRSHTAPQ